MRLTGKGKKCLIRAPFPQKGNKIQKRRVHKKKKESPLSGVRFATNPNGS